MLKLWIAFSLIATALFSAEYPLLRRLQKAKVGDFVVFEANKTVTLLAIRSLSSQSLVLEEISAPLAKVKHTSWANWVQSKAPGHTSWSMIEIDLENQRVLECYSFNKQAWTSRTPQDSFIATLFHLALTPIELNDRRKIGLPPQEGEPDHRKIWNPPLVIDGKKIEGTSFDAYQAVWPKDQSELSGKVISIYFDKEIKSALPCWIQIDTGQITASLRAIDSGHKLPASNRKTMPRRTPEWVGSPIKTKEGLRLSIKSPKYYKQFELFAVDVTNKEKHIHLIHHSLVEGQGELLNLDIHAKELRQVLQVDHKYTWLIVPSGHSESYCETQKPFTYQG